MIQNFAPSNLNRDDTNSPKDCEFGGYRRARISSQCLKRAIRKNEIFAETTGVGIGERTKYIHRILSEKLAEEGKDSEEINSVLKEVIPNILTKLDKKKATTDTMIYLGPSEVQFIFEQIKKNWDGLTGSNQKKTLEEIKKTYLFS